MSKFIEYDTFQDFIFPPSMSEWLPTDHIVYFVRDAVMELDLSKIYAVYKNGGEGGRPAFSPRMLVAVWIFAHMVGIRSSRRLQRALLENIAFRVLSGNQQPDFWTLNTFRTKHREALGDLLVETVRIARKLELAPMKQAAIDGTRIQANASKHSAMSYDRMVEKEKELQDEIQEYLRECDEADKRDDEKYGPKRSDQLPEDLKETARRLEKIRAAKAALEAEAREKARAEQEQRRQQAEEEGRTFHPRINPDDAKPDPKAQRNFTDPESRILSKRGKDIIQGYNAQAAVDADTQIILAADLGNNASDCPQLLPMLEQVRANTGATPEEVTADAGYFSERNVEEAEKMLPNANVLIPPDRLKHERPRKTDSTPPSSGQEIPAAATDSAQPSSDVKTAAVAAESGSLPGGEEVTSTTVDSTSVSTQDGAGQWVGEASTEGTIAAPAIEQSQASAQAHVNGYPQSSNHAKTQAGDPSTIDPTSQSSAATQTDATTTQPDDSDSKPTRESAAIRMRKKLDTEPGRQRYKQRRCSVEPVFGQIKGARGLRQFLHRGQEKVRHMWRFECAVHNLLKIFRSGKRLVPV